MEEVLTKLNVMNERIVTLDQRLDAMIEKVDADSVQQEEMLR